MKKYLAHSWKEEIEEVEVVRETGHFVILPPNQWRKKESRVSNDRYFDTWDEAHALLLREAQSDIDSYRRRLESANSKLGNVKGMKKPA